MTPDICLCGHDAHSCPHTPWQHTRLVGHHPVGVGPYERPLIPWADYKATIGVTVSGHPIGTFETITTRRPQRRQRSAA